MPRWPPSIFGPPRFTATGTTPSGHDSPQTDAVVRAQALREGLTETVGEQKHIVTPAEVIIEEVMTELRRLFRQPAIEFARGSKLRREGRAPYLYQFALSTMHWPIPPRTRFADSDACRPPVPRRCRPPFRFDAG